MIAMKTPRILITLLIGALTPMAALAHPGHAEIGAGFVAGLLHPLTGLDHVLMIVAVSLWSAQLRPAAHVIIAASLGLFVAIGALAPASSLAGPGLEAAIALTVIGSGVLLAAGRRWPTWATACFAALFALIHGFAHGAEGPAGSAAYVPGLIAATSGLALSVSFAAARLQTHRAWLRGVGIVGAITGTFALFNS